MTLLLLRAVEVEALLDLDALVDHLATAFTRLSAGEVSVPPRIAASTPDGFLAAMPGHVPGMCLETKLVSVFPGNHDHGLPSHQALIAVFDEATGTPVALLDGTVITAVRTAAASALSVRLLARPGARVLAILGAGVQARTHLDAVVRVLRPGEVRIAARNRAHAEALTGRAGGARVTASFEEAVRGADVVCCCTDAATPILRREWLSPGAHVTSVGCARNGPEVDEATVAAATLFVESRAAAQPYPAGAHELQGVDPARLTELGELLAATRPGRTGDAELTLYKSTGHAVEDAAAADLVLRAAQERGVGTAVEL